MSYKPDKGIRNREDKMIIKTSHAHSNIASKCAEQQLVKGQKTNKQKNTPISEERFNLFLS